VNWDVLQRCGNTGKDAVLAYKSRLVERIRALASHEKRPAEQPNGEFVFSAHPRCSTGGYIKRVSPGIDIHSHLRPAGSAPSAHADDTSLVAHSILVARLACAHR
jgi:hypothetical protein